MIIKIVTLLAIKIIQSTAGDVPLCVPGTRPEVTAELCMSCPANADQCVPCSQDGCMNGKYSIQFDDRDAWSMTALTIYSSSKDSKYDPDQVVIRGSNDFGMKWKKIKRQALSWNSRSTATTVFFENEKKYKSYQIELQKLDGTRIMYIGKMLNPKTDPPPTSAPTNPQPTTSPTNSPTDTPTNSPTDAQKVKGLPTQEVTWVRGEAGATCDDTCTPLGLSCSSYEQTQIDTYAKAVEAFRQAGYTCKGQHPARAYPGSPFSTGRSDDCAYFGRSGLNNELDHSTCSANVDDGHRPLCACVPMKVTWVRGEAGATCGDTCKPLGLMCSSYEQTQINTYAKVVEAFKQAGYTCKGPGDKGGARAYPGSPFSTGRSDDCYYFGRSGLNNELDQSSCSANVDDGHRPLCACV